MTSMHTLDVEAEITLLPTAEGGRKTATFSGYRPNHKVREDYLTSGEIQYIGCDELLPGQTVHGTIMFAAPKYYPHSLWVGREIAIQEGGRVVGHARITAIFNPLLERLGQPLPSQPLPAQRASSMSAQGNALGTEST